MSIENFLDWQDDFIEYIKSDIHTNLPAKITEYDPLTNTATVQILADKLTPEEEVIRVPPLYHVPIWSYQSGDFSVILPVKAGDLGHVMFFERDIEEYLNKSDHFEPTFARRHDMNDCIFISGFYPVKENRATTLDSIRIGTSKNENMVVEIKDKSLNIKHETKNIITVEEDGTIKAKQGDISIIFSSGGLIVNKLDVQKFKIGEDGTVSINSSVSIDGNMLIDGDVTVNGDIYYTGSLTKLLT